MNSNGVTIVGSTLTFVLAFSVLTGGHAQFAASGKDDALLVSKNKLAVVLKIEDPKEVQYLQKKKPKELDGYRKSIENYNEFLKEIVTSEWKLASEVMFISESEAEKLKKSNEKAIYLLEPAEIRSYGLGNMPTSLANNKNIVSAPGSNIQYLSSPVGSLQIILSAKPRMPIALSYWPDLPLTRGTMLAVVQHLHNQIEDAIKADVSSFADVKKEVAKRDGSLKKKTLLVISESYNGEWDEREQKNVQSVYKWPVKYVNLSEAESKMLNHDEHYAYTWVVPAGAHSGSTILYNYFIMDAKDGRILFVTGKSRTQNGMIGVGHLEDAFKTINNQ